MACSCGRPYYSSGGCYGFAPYSLLKEPIKRSNTLLPRYETIFYFHALCYILSPVLVNPLMPQCRGVAKPLCFAETARVSLMACRFEWGNLHPACPNFPCKSLCIKNFILNTFSFRFFCKLRLKSCIFILCFLRFFAYFQLFFSLSARPALHAGNPAFCFLAFFIFIVVFIKYF